MMNHSLILRFSVFTLVTRMAVNSFASLISLAVFIGLPGASPCQLVSP